MDDFKLSIVNYYKNFMKLFLKCFLMVYFSANLFSQSDKIRIMDITVEGNQRLTAQDVQRNARLYKGMTFLSFLETHNQEVLKGFDFAFGALFFSCDPMLYMGLAFWISGVKFVKKVQKCCFGKVFGQRVYRNSSIPEHFLGSRRRNRRNSYFGEVWGACSKLFLYTR